MYSTFKIFAIIAGLFLKEPSDTEDFHDDEYMQQQCEEESNEVATENCECPKYVQLTEDREPDWTSTPNAGPCVTYGSNMFITAEFIAWSTREENLGFILKGESVTDTILSSTSKGRIIHPDWKLESGFKVGVGMLFDCDGWDFHFNYTWLVTKTDKTTVAATANKTLTDLNWLQSPINPIISPISETAAKWRHNFNVLDLELGRNFFISKCLQLRPHFGLKGTWKNKKWM